MIQRRQELRFPLETSEAFPILVELLGKDFDGNVPLELRIPRPENFSG